MGSPPPPPPHLWRLLAHVTLHHLHHLEELHLPEAVDHLGSQSLGLGAQQAQRHLAWMFLGLFRLGRALGIIFPSFLGQSLSFLCLAQSSQVLE